MKSYFGICIKSKPSTERNQKILDEVAYPLQMGTFYDQDLFFASFWQSEAKFHKQKKRSKNFAHQQNVNFSKRFPHKKIILTCGGKEKAGQLSGQHCRRVLPTHEKNIQPSLKPSLAPE